MKGVHIYILVCSVALLFLVAGFLHAQTEEVDIEALVEGCGDVQIESGEDCDGSNLNGATCQTEGFTSGTLSCTASCVFNTSLCTLSSGGGGGGGSGGTNNASVVLVGKAYPSSKITILKDGQLIAETIASSRANFQVSVSGLSRGSYVFGVYGEDQKARRSASLNFPVTVSRGTLTKIEDIFISPTIAVDKSMVRKGDTIDIFGQSVPQANITLEVNSPQQFFVQTPTDNSGVYLHSFDSAVLDMGDHSTRSKSATNTEISAQSLIVGFKVGTQNIMAQASTKCPQKADLNTDCKVNLVDFSIAAFWYNRTLSESFAVREREHLNGDGKINLVDFSIMAYYWTG